jgi:hypothetical protein
METNTFNAALLSFGEKAAALTGKYHPQSGFSLEVWRTADELFKAGELVTVSTAALVLPASHKASNVSVELSAWRKYHGIKAGV